MFPLQRGAATLSAVMLTILVMHSRDGAFAAGNNMRVVCYYTNWSVYRPGTAKFTPQNINPYLCTHLIYSFGGFTKENTLKPYDKYQDIEQGGFAKFTGLKTYNKQLKTLLAIGGWNEGSSRFSPLVADAQRREQFTRNTIKFLRQYHFDGLDLDWEYPAFRDGSKPKDRENYAQLVQELREEFEREATKTGRPKLLLTMAVPAGVEYLEKGYDVQKLNKYLDWFNLLSYDYHSAYEPAVNHHSPLFPVEEASEYSFDSELNIDYSVKYFLNAGADRDKLVLGIPTYGRSYTLYNPDATEIGAPADGPGEQGDSTREKGYLAYYEICSNLKKNSDWTVVQPNPKAMGPYAYKGNQWVGYDDEAIARIKAKYVAENNLGGIMFWSIDNDDFRGTCHGKPYPIIEAAKEALLANTDVGVNDIASPSGPRKINRARKRPTTHNRVNTVSNNDIKPSFNTMQDRKVGHQSRIMAATTASTEGSSLVGGRTTTPQPPTTPDPGADFKCTDEGFFPHPRDCKKYFWCLESPSLGLVAHHFTCPSGLVFNKLADSCDYARNVKCSKHAPITSTTTIIETSARTTPVQSTSTTQRSRITSGSRNTFFSRPATTTTTTSTTTEEPVVETDLKHEEDTEQQPEEDPKVIKELIALIKKVGGIEELEKQLQAQEDDSIVLVDTGVTDSISTTPSTTISKSLYERVLSHTSGTVGQKFRPGITFTQKDHTWTSPENKYSSVVRNSYSNSRVGPQNEGLDLLPEFEGVFREKPKYVTLNRARPTNPSVIEDRFDDSDSHDGEEDAIEEGENQTSTVAGKRTASNTKYVNIMRHRPSITSEQEEKGDSDEETRESFIQHSVLNRNRFRLTTEPTQSVAEETERALPSRYNIIDRRRTASVPQYTSSRLQAVNRDDVGTDSSLLVPSTDFQTIYTTAPITTSNVTRPSETNSTSYSTLRSSGVERGSANASNSSVVDSNNISSNISADKSNSSNSTYAGTTQAQGIQYFSMTTSLNGTNTPNSDVPSEHQQHEQHYVLNVDYQVEAPVEASDTVPTIANPTGDLVNAIELTLESTTVPYQSEDVSAGGSTGVFGSSTESDNTLGIGMKRRTAGYNASVKPTTGLSSTLPIKTTTTTVVPILIPTNDAPPHNVKFKFMQRTRKPLTTTTTTLEPITNIGTGSDFIPTKATPRPFTSGLRRTRPTHPSVAITKNSAASSVVDTNLTTLRSVKVSFSNSQTLEPPPGRQRRVGNAAADSDSAINGGRLVEKQHAEAMRPVPHSNRGRVRFRSSTEQETVHPGDSSGNINDNPFPALPTSSSSVNTLSSPTALRRRSRPSSSADSAANRFAVGRPSTVPSADAADLKETTSTLSSIRRANFNLYSGRGTTTKQEMKFGSSTETTATNLDARTSYDTVTINPDLVKTYTHVADNPLMAQERILLTLGTAIRYGFNSRNQLTNDHKVKLVQEQTIPTSTISSVPSMGRPFGSNHQNAASMADSAFDEVVNDMSTEAMDEQYATKKADLFTLYSVNTPKVDTTTPQQRKVTVTSYVLPTRVAPERSTTELTDTTIKVMISKENTNKTFIHGRTRPTSPPRLRTTSRPVNSDGTIIEEQEAIDGTKPVPESSRKAFDVPRHPPKTQKQSHFRSTSTINDVTERGPSISTTKRQRGSSRRRTTTLDPPPNINARDHNNQFPKTLSDQRLFASRTIPITKTVPDDSTIVSLLETITVGPTSTFPDSKASNSDFTTVFSVDMSNELADNDNKEATYIADDWTLETLATPMVTEKTRFQGAVSAHNSINQLFNDSQQIESESILSRSPVRGAGVTSNAVRKFTEYILPTKPSEPTEQTRKYVPTRRNRPSFSLARNSRPFTTTPTENGAFDSSTSVTTTTPSKGLFVPQRRRKPLPRDKVINNGTNNDDESGEPFSTRTTRRRPANSLNRLSRPQSFEDSFDKATLPTKPLEHKIINRTSVLLPKRPNLFARTTVATTTTGKPIFVTGDETTDDRTLNEEEQQHYGVQEEDNEIQRQSKKLFGSVGSDVGNSVLSESSELPTGFRRPASLGQYLRISSGGSRVTTGTSSNRFIFNNNQPPTDGATVLAASTTTQRSITTRSRRPFGNVSGYKPTTQNVTAAAGAGGFVASLPGGITTPRPRFTPTTRTRLTFGRQRSTTFPASSAIEKNAFGEGQLGAHAPQSGAEPELSSIIARRYQPRKQTSRRNLTTTTEPKLNTEYGVAKRNRTNQSSLFTNSEKQGRLTIPPHLLFITTTEMDSNAASTPFEGAHKMTTSLPMSEATTSFASKPFASTGWDSMASLAVTSATTTVSTQRLADTENEIVENTTAYFEDSVNTFRTTTEYYTASDETHYTTLNTADTIYTINDNIDIDDVNVLQDRGRTSTTTVKPTTLYHVFSIDKENETVPSSTEIYRTEEQEIELPAANGTDKLVQIHRVVEIYSKNFSNPDELPVMQKLGEINRKIIIRLVEPNRANRTANSSNSVTTTATMFGSSGAEYPATATEGTDQHGKNGNEIQGPNVVLSSNSIFTVETSTIPLEGLFDPEQKREFDFPTTESPPVDLETVAPQQDFERISSVEYATTNVGNMAPVDDEPFTITPIEVATERYTQVTETRVRPSPPPHTSTGYEYNDNQIMEQKVAGEQKRIVTTISATNNAITTATTATEAAPVASSTHREIVHKYTLPAEFSFQEPSSEATPTTTTRTAIEVTTIAEEVPTTPQIPKTMKATATAMRTTTTTENPETPTVERVQPLVLPSKESKLKYAKRPTGQKPARLLDFAYNRDADSSEHDDGGQLTTTKPLLTEPSPSQTSSLKANTARIFPNGRKYVSLLSQRANLTLPDTAATTLNASSSFRKSKDIQVLLPPKTTTSMTTTAFTKSVNTITRSNIPTTRPTVITKIDFNIKYVLPASFPDREAHKLKIESKNDKYSIPLSPILRPDFVTREISGERQERQFSPVYRPELDNDELTRQLTSDSDPVALEAASLHREILDSDATDSLFREPESRVLNNKSEQVLNGRTVPSSAVYFQRRSAEVPKPMKPIPVQ